MISLRHKLWLGFGTLLLILLAVSVITAIVLTNYSHGLERIFRENYDSRPSIAMKYEGLPRSKSAPISIASHSPSAPRRPKQLMSPPRLPGSRKILISNCTTSPCPAKAITRTTSPTSGRKISRH